MPKPVEGTRGKWAKLISPSCFPWSRPDGGSGRQRADVRVGSLPADHLLQESRQLQSHQDPIQPPRQQGNKPERGWVRHRHTCPIIFSLADCIVMCACRIEEHFYKSAHSSTDQTRAAAGSSSSAHIVLHPVTHRSDLRLSPPANNILRWCRSCASTTLSACSDQELNTL